MVGSDGGCFVISVASSPSRLRVISENTHGNVSSSDP